MCVCVCVCVWCGVYMYVVCDVCMCAYVWCVYVMCSVGGVCVCDVWCVCVSGREVCESPLGVEEFQRECRWRR